MFNANFSFVKLKFMSTLIKGLRVWAEPIKSFHYNSLSGANSKAVAAKTKFEKQATALKRNNKKTPSSLSFDGVNNKNIFFICFRY